MEQVTLKSNYGSTGFTARTLLRHPDSGKVHYENVHYEFSSDTDFRAKVPQSLWNELQSKMFDPKLGLKYSEAFRSL